jgi:hypothetical protein
MISADADVLARMELRASLPDDDAAGSDLFSAESFHAQALALAISTVAAGAAAFFVCHFYILLPYAWIVSMRSRV